MCGRYTLKTPASVLTELFGIEEAPSSVTPSYNIAPTQGWPPCCPRTARGSWRCCAGVWSLLG
jgi:putative SOS response-associated peptidase YedK